MALSPSKMFFRLLLRAATVRRGRTLTALLAMVVAATLATALMNLYSDIGAKLSGDFRNFGANVIVTSDHELSEAEMARVTGSLGSGTEVVPSAFAVAKTVSGKPIVVVGTDLQAAKNLNTFWAVTSWATSGALVGNRAATVLAAEQQPELEFNGKRLLVRNAGELHTGGEEDSRIYLSLPEFSAWTGLKPTIIELGIQGTSNDVSTRIAEMQHGLPKGMTAQPVRQIVEAETRVLGKTKFILLLSVIAITLTVALCVLATLTASVLERRKDYAVMKALGSSQKTVNGVFLGETFALAVAGSLAGFVAGCGLAMWIGRVNFHAAVEPRLSVFPAVFGGCVVVAMISALVPLALLQKSEPAVMLKGD